MNSWQLDTVVYVVLIIFVILYAVIQDEIAKHIRFLTLLSFFIIVASLCSVCGFTFTINEMSASSKDSDLIYMVSIPSLVLGTISVIIFARRIIKVLKIRRRAKQIFHDK